jgi:uncharacterized protein YndB with AHSA1/START domain
MPAAKPDPATRKHEHTFEIAASPQDVWHAITNVQELVNWFVFDSDVDPREGGHITYGWGEELRAKCHIHVWQPPVHLRTGWLTHLNPKDGSESQVVVDWFLEGAAGKTRLRLVHSGFSTSSAWDNEYEGTNRGWQFELSALKHYLEHHRGEPRTAFVARRPTPLDKPAFWNRMFAAEGFAPLPGIEKLKVGDPVQFSLASGDSVKGTVVQNVPPYEFSFTAESLNRALVRLAHENCYGQPEAQVWVSLWNVPPAESQALKMRLGSALAKVLA